MSALKKILFALLLIGSAQLQAQNLSDLFAKSYAAEKIGSYTEAINAMQAQTHVAVYEVNLRLGWLYYSSKKHSESVTYYQKAMVLKPTATEPLWGLIYPLIAQEKWNSVEQAYKNILKLDGKNSKANYYLGSIYFYRKDYANAKKYLQEVYNLYPFDREAGLLLGWSYYYLGNKVEAKNLFQHVLNNKPDDASALEGLALVK
ncbi:MAG: tetratricopeptide repeat protein [bacterium]|nr:tetratricopeptide repeat protein [bacterium]